jgi:RNA polymerase sigma factor (sigma-70 family)
VNVLSDERLARLVGQGDDRAFGALYSRFHQPIYRYCHSMVRHEADAQDALQSTFASALTALQLSQRDAPLRPWLFRIAHNESISLLRRRRPAVEVPETLEASGQSVEGTAEERARLALLVADLQALPERQRGALVMRELSGLSHEEVAQSLGVSVGAAKQTVFEARQALAEFAEGRAMPCDEIQRVISDGDRRSFRGRRVRAHLRECSQCQTFAQAIPDRRTALLALSPALPAAAASGLFGQITGAAGAHHGSSGGLLATAGSKSLGVALSAKSLATGIAVVAVATTGTVGAIEVATHIGHHPVVPASLVRSGGESGGSAGGASSSAGGASSGKAANSLSSQAAGGRGQQSVSQAVAGRTGSPAGNSQHAGGSSSGATTNTGAGAGQGASGQGNGGSASNPNAGGNPTNSHQGNPNAGRGNTGGSTNAGGTNPNSHGGNANHHAGNTNAHGGNPKSNGGGSSTSHGSNPKSSGGGGSNSHGSNPNAAGGSTKSNSSTSHGSNPNAAGGNTKSPSTSSTSHGTNSKSHGANSHGAY